MENINNEASVDSEEMRKLKHDVRNQLSNINLALQGLRFELNDLPEDCAFYLNAIDTSCAKIDKLIKST